MKSASPTDRPATCANRRAAIRARHRRAAISAAASAVVCGQQAPSCTLTTSNCRSKNSNRFHHRNQQYSVIALTDGSGAIEERYAYSAYGEPVFANASATVLADSAKDNRYTYTGREWDEELSLYHFRARIYNAESGRFCGRDPIGFVDGTTTYTNYFALISTDPTGLAIYVNILRRIPCNETGLGLCRRMCWDNDEIYKGCECFQRHIELCGFIHREKWAVPTCERNNGKKDNGCKRIGNRPPMKKGGCWQCRYDCRGPRYPGGGGGNIGGPIIRYVKSGPCPDRILKFVPGFVNEADCENSDPGVKPPILISI